TLKGFAGGIQSLLATSLSFFGPCAGKARCAPIRAESSLGHVSSALLKRGPFKTNGESPRGSKTPLANLRSFSHRTRTHQDCRATPSFWLRFNCFSAERNSS